MKMKVTFPSGRTATYLNNIESLMKSFEMAGIRYELIKDNTPGQRSNR